MADSRNAGIQSRGNYKTSFLHCQSLGQLWSPTTSSLGAMLNRDSKEGSSGGPPRHLWGSLKRWRLAETEYGWHKARLQERGPPSSTQAWPRNTHVVCRRGLSTPWVEDQELSGKSRVKLGHTVPVFTCQSCLRTYAVAENTQEEHTKQNPERDREERKRC